MKNRSEEKEGKCQTFFRWQLISYQGITRAVIVLGATTRLRPTTVRARIRQLIAVVAKERATRPAIREETHSNRVTMWVMLALEPQLRLSSKHQMLKLVRVQVKQPPATRKSHPSLHPYQSQSRLRSEILKSAAAYRIRALST